MRLFIRIFTALITMLWFSASIAVPVNANSGVSFYHDIIIASGGQLPVGLESRDNPTDNSFFSASSDLQAPDAVDFNDTHILINGLGPETPSVFSAISTDTRNAATEGSFASNNTQLYLVHELEIVPDGTNDTSEEGIGGNGQAQATLSTELYDTQGVSDVFFERTFTFSNQNLSALTFGIQGDFEMDLFATADGQNSFANTFAQVDMFFSSQNPLDIVFADTSPYVNNQNEVGDNALFYLQRETDVANTGHLSLTGSASAIGTNIGGLTQAFGNSAMSYALGITLLPGEEITMSHRVTYSNLAMIGEGAVKVPEPSSGLLMLFAFGLLVFRRQKQSLGG
ncbi:PEP-CTERM sorting domain-containing protein [Marinobacter sp. 2_MG-2023]|uniref:PEP-CTERM sorting domain-containing protein n=1 Tax=Marinobacter sp. 2_MG-2023 TaxID=3062679 RepID=UPI0026E30998|nr:PEP-CTERM sorting domain-containing protein [Marinobacter sp. 2_MG-2023]MDO6442044.1 PEP-CTERM sorting domain-containing protein [Marinobacter sp. 2_MG-2023]